MKAIARSTVLALAAFSTVSALAQPLSGDAPRTRDQVRQEAAAWIAAGYDPNDWLHYPDNAIRANRVITQRAAPAQPNER
ncbi:MULTISPECIES: DUF4148 domain-containing protein [unclassified Caballeronia]|uniref:DUF4148 domain-containing protein n=1 Tax=unclassified Caballeronia TaxID=2646786 RepID=UPI0028666B56|nr:MULTISPECIES: DUF4148 domain-containing protein [unclassified Caballeronia]MDR5739753.1 DUF4148 domain-containing protein [Caballeronia sp. LZ016]MDR5808218.1 DUF4148 domain-containing protein [Caballeronia sp. LZ019]